jgi:ATP-binding cassette subfamily F protein 3
LGLRGRNGCGKSTVLQAIADKLIPGIPPSLRIHIVSQINEEVEVGNEGQTALQRVLDGHVERTDALREKSS